MNWQIHPLIRLVIPFVLGMVGAKLFICHMNISVLFLLCCVVLAFLFWIALKPQSTYKDIKFGVVAMTFTLLLGTMLYTQKHHRIEHGIPSDSILCCGILTEPPIEKAHSWALHLKQENGTHLLLYIGKGQASTPTLSLGDTIFAHILHLNATSTSTDSTFRPYYDHLFRQGISATAYAPANQWTAHPHQGALSLPLRAKSIQSQLHHIYNDRGIHGEAGSIVEAMTIGQKATLSTDLRHAYATSGISHILALSGFHVGIIVVLLQALLLHYFTPHHLRWITNLLTILALWSFAFIAGFSPSLTRATLMCTLLLLSQSFSHELLSINSCALALLIMLCFSPLQLHDVGFQLSFVSVTGICLFSSHLQALLSPHHIILRLLLSLLAITLICSLATAPLVAYHFGQLPLLGLLSNLLITPFVYLIMYTSILWWFFLWCAPISTFLTDLLNWTATTMNSLTESISSLPFASIEWHPNTLTTLLCYALLLTLTYFITRKRQTL